MPAIGELLGIAQEMGVKLIACQMTTDMMNLTKRTLLKESKKEEPQHLLSMLSMRTHHQHFNGG